MTGLAADANIVAIIAATKTAWNDVIIFYVSDRKFGRTYLATALCQREGFDFGFCSEFVPHAATDFQFR